ncbi:GNAT family N-acetyltransferase [Solwaraspora sp. WMMD1047]|uniref:GNAT family N-acetyltransferase n=1 Tax=Solwaraspora sp. WMMD1047 TaxID=3016102 RepID=UPI002415D7C7|nr:GNAT family N-acetyltransferase [Solwaraspora sp. WMMD1047]MDG4828639.1 GNAT family N-acetyltransferase [Solwaraspora sp. WMMD1047]
MTIELRPATADDLMPVGALHHLSRATTYRDIVPAEALAAVTADQMGRYWTERWQYERDSHLMTVAERAGRLIGFSYVGPHAHAEPDVGELSAIHVHPAEQGRGVGRALMTDALATLHRRGWRRAVLWVLAGNSHARDFYARCGWTPDGVERDDDIGTATTRQLRYVRDLP